MSAIHRLELITDLGKLRAKAKKVSKWKGIRTGKKLMQFIVRNSVECVGLAAPQLGLDERVFVLWDKKDYAVFINPRIIELGAIEEEGVEGCLSIPGKAYKVRRPTSVVIKDAIRTTPIELTGLVARAWLHELDHLNGKLICDIGVEVSPDETEQTKTL